MVPCARPTGGCSRSCASASRPSSPGEERTVPVPRGDVSPADALSRYREALIAGASEDELADLGVSVEPDLVETVRWRRETGRRERSTPDPQFAKRLEQELMQAF